jgi:hypothetical protein
MEGYKTIININLNGAGMLYRVKEDIKSVKNMFEKLDYGTGIGFKFVIFYNALENNIRLIEMLFINPSNCASVEIYEIK